MGEKKQQKQGKFCNTLKYGHRLRAYFLWPEKEELTVLFIYFFLKLGQGTCGKSI